jgi:hypothetical protein
MLVTLGRSATPPYILVPYYATPEYGGLLLTLGIGPNRPYSVYSIQLRGCNRLAKF